MCGAVGMPGEAADLRAHIEFPLTG
eukprot:COSAG04_NODE_29521_length_268_cov_0.911243_1_plen_24_part_10